MSPAAILIAGIIFLVIMSATPLVSPAKVSSSAHRGFCPVCGGKISVKSEPTL